MPMQRGKSSLLARYGQKLQQAHEAHKADETTYGVGSDLPAGIEGGVAQLVDAKFDVYKTGPNKDRFYFYAAGIVKSPAEASGVPIAGLRTQITEAVCDTPQATGQRKTLEEHYAWVLNELRKLGLDTTSVDADSIEAAVAALKESRPHFRFRTWKGAKQTSGPYKDREPRVNHEWRGVCEFSDEEAPDGIADETGITVQTPTSPGKEGVDIEALVRAAKADDEEAQAQLSEMAIAAGMSQEEVDAVGSWAELAERVQSVSDKDAEPEQEPWIPQKGELYDYKAPKAHKAEEVEVIAVFEAKQLVNVKRLSDNKVVKGVAWADLIGSEA